jgi:hypothetical protein
MLSSLADPTIKIQCLRGLGNIVGVGAEEANRYASTVLDALMANIDDSNETIAMEGMNGLSKVSRHSCLLCDICDRCLHLWK